MKQLPENVSKVSRTASFTKETVPAALLKDHSTKKGAWGKLVVESGFVYYTITDSEEIESHEINQSNYGVIAPEQLHHVELMTDDTVFHIEFME